MDKKHWIISYSIKYTDGVTDETETTVEADDIQQALDIGLIHVRQKTDGDDSVEDVCIWNIGIVEDDVFPVVFVQSDEEED